MRARGHWELSRSAAPAGGRRRGMAADRVVDATARSFGADKFEPGLLRRTVDDERHADGLESLFRVEGEHLYVFLGMRLAAGIDLEHHARRVLHVEHRRVPHRPKSVARVWIVRELDGHRPALTERVLDLPLDLVVGEIREKRELTLREAHG